jgi:hypothetical protein
MNAITTAFQAVISEANRAHKIYNTHGPDAGALALAALEDQCATLREHLAIESARVKAREVKQ